MVSPRTIMSVWLLFLLTAGITAAQTPPEKAGKWSGKLDLRTGYGWPLKDTEGSESTLDTIGHFWEQLAAQVSYTTPKFTWSTELQGQFERNQTQEFRISIKGNGQNQTNLKVTQFLRPATSWRSDLRWRPSEARQYHAFVTYQYGFNRTTNGNLEAMMLFDDLNRVFISDELRKEDRHNFTAGFRSSRQLAIPRRSLHFSADLRGTYQAVCSEWEKLLANSQAEMSNDFYVYRLTPRTNNNDINLDFLYRDSLLTGLHSLVLEPGFRIRTQETREYNSGAVLEGADTWRDSLRLRESFDFVQLMLVPHLRSEYRHRSFRAAADYELQFYGRQLTNDIHYERPNWTRPNLAGRSLVEWNPSAANQLVLGTTLSVRYPGFRQICWFDRQGSDPTQLFRGDPDLLPSQTISADFTWLLRYKRFRATTRSTYTRRQNELEQTFWEEIIEGHTYRIFTWSNTALARVFTQEAGLGWNGSMFSANLQLLYRQTKQEALIQETSNKSHYSELSLNTSFRPGLGWEFSASGFYRGEVQTFYSLLGAYYTVNARIEKKFKSFAVSLEGRDLLDAPVSTQYFSADGNDVWATESRLSRRIFVLGFSWNF